MKYFIPLLLAFFFVSHNNLHGIIHYEEGDTLYNWANSGLHLRIEKEIDSKVLQVIPYGSALIVFESKWHQNTDNCEVKN